MTFREKWVWLVALGIACLALLIPTVDNLFYGLSHM